MSKRSGVDPKNIIEPSKKVRIGVITRALSKNNPQEVVSQDLPQVVPLKQV